MTCSSVAAFSSWLDRSLTNQLPAIERPIATFVRTEGTSMAAAALTWLYRKHTPMDLNYYYIAETSHTELVPQPPASCY